MHKTTQAIAKCGDVSLQIAIVRMATEHARITVADLIMQLDEDNVGTSVTMPGLGYEDLEKLGDRILKAAANLRQLCGAKAEPASAAHHPTSYANDAHLTHAVSNAIGDTLKKYGFKTAAVDDRWVGTMSLAEASLVAMDELVGMGVTDTERLVEGVRSRLQYLTEAQMPGVLDMMHWPGSSALADVVCGVAIRSRQGL